MRTAKIHWDSTLAQFFLKKEYQAITVGRHIFIKSPESLLTVPQHKKILDHEKCHVDQYARYGFWRFIFKYTVNRIRYGYEDNPLEKECRK